MSNFTPMTPGIAADVENINAPLTELDGVIGDWTQLNPDIKLNYQPPVSVVEALNGIHITGKYRGFRTETTDFTTAILKNPGDWGFQAFKNEIQINVGNGGIIIAILKTRTVSTP